MPEYVNSIPNTPKGVQQVGSNSARLASSIAASITLTERSKWLVQEQLGKDYSSCPMAALRLQYTLLDLAYYMEKSSEFKDSEASRIITTIYKELELPVLQPNIDAAHAYLVGLFLSGHPIFGVVSTKVTEPASDASTNAAKQMEAIIEENSRTTGWARQLALVLKNGLKYNICAAEVDWKVRRTYNLTTDTNISFTAAKKTEIFRAGNEIRALDMYNTAFDVSVSPADVHTSGDFALNIEVLTLAQCHARIADIKAAGGVIMGEGEKLWNSSPYRNWHHIPRVREDKIDSGASDWISFFSHGGTSPMTQGRTRKYEWVTYYRRIIPAMFGFTGVPDATMVQVWKFVEVNGVLVLAERQSNAHNYIPIIFAQPIEDSLGLQTKGLGANLLPFQNLSGTMFRARIASLARALSDRGLYDPSRISEKHINSQNPAVKIPVRPAAYSKGLADAYYPIPFDDRNAQNLYQDIGAVQSWASDAAHINRAQRGQFTKGNRTLAEYADVMDNADASQQTMALLLEFQFFVPVKRIVKINILQYQSSATLPDPNTLETVEVDPTQLRSAILEFKLADGLLPKDKILGIPQLMEAFQFLFQSQQANQEYDLTAMFIDAMEARGARIKSYKRQLPPGATPGQPEPATSPSPV